jgi:hypothetical protein
VQTAIQKLRKEFKDNEKAWAKHIPMAQLAMNTSIVALHNSSPFSLFFARKFNGFHNCSNHKNELLSQEELLQRLEYMTKVVFPAIDIKSKETQRKMVERFNATILHNDFPDGAKVMTLDPIKGDKLTPAYEGPYTVVRRTVGGTYELRDGTGAFLNRNYAPSQMKLVLEEPSDSPAYEVETILEHEDDDSQPGKYLYYTKWKGYKKPTWEPEDMFIERGCIRKYWHEAKASEEEERQKANVKSYQTRRQNNKRQADISTTAVKRRKRK